jgi:hypothetical protein
MTGNLPPHPDLNAILICDGCMLPNRCCHCYRIWWMSMPWPPIPIILRPDVAQPE